MYFVKVVISRKWYTTAENITTVRTTVAYQILPFPMTLGDFVQLCITSALPLMHCLFAIAKFFVIITVITSGQSNLT